MSDAAQEGQAWGTAMRVLRVDHIGIAVRALEPVIEFYRSALGLEVLHREVVESQKVSTAFIPAGETRLELLEPTDPTSPIAPYLERRGEGIHHVAFRVDDVDAAIAHLKAAGATLLSDTARPGANGTRVVFMHPRSAHGVLIELVEGSR